jgi:hypothetical protein
MIPFSIYRLRKDTALGPWSNKAVRMIAMHDDSTTTIEDLTWGKAQSVIPASYVLGSRKLTKSRPKEAAGVSFWVMVGTYGKILHREDGPAISYASGDTSWMLNGFRVNCMSEFQRQTGLSDEDALMLTLKYGPIR